MEHLFLFMILEFRNLRTKTEYLEKQISTDFCNID